jgi:hypothetical protein
MNRKKERIMAALEKEHFRKIATDTWKLDLIKVCYIVMTKQFIASYGRNDIEIKTPEDVKVAVEIFRDPLYWFKHAETTHLTKTFT